MRRLRLGVIGVGHLGKAHARIAAGLDCIELVGVVDPVESNRTQVAAAHQVEACAHHRELLGRIDAVVIATPTRFHQAVALDLAAHGVHLFIEKPITSTLSEADELLAMAERHGVLVQVGHVERFNPVLTGVLPHVRDPKYIDACRASTFKFRSTDIGVVFDLMIHDIDLVLSLARSPVVDVDALGISIFGQFEDVANARLTFENGCVATLTASRASYQAVRQMQIWCERTFASLDFATRNARLVHPHESLLRREFDTRQLSMSEVDHLKDHLFEDLLRIEDVQGEACDQLTAEQLDFADSIRNARAPRVSGSQGRDAVAVAERVLEKIAEHQWDGQRAGRIGALAQPAPAIIPGPHWHLPAAREMREVRERKEAG